MLTRLEVRNFKKLRDVEIDLGRNVVFIGPNNSGKSTALQALSLWGMALEEWGARRSGKSSPEKRPGININRKDIIDLPVPDAKLLWNNLRVRRGVDGGTKNIRIDVQIDAILDNQELVCGFELDYGNEESITVRPLRKPGFELAAVKETQFIEVPEALFDEDGVPRIRIAMLPPMSGLVAEEAKIERGRIHKLIGEGQTAQVLRNLCYMVSSQEDPTGWKSLCQSMKKLFGITLNDPRFLPLRGSIVMTYQENEVTLDLSCAGRGLQQTLLLLAHLYANPRTVLLLDEPDAHLEILRQRQTYRILSEVAEAQGSQIIAASHSEVVLNEAVGTGQVIAFVGRPHILGNRPSQVLKALQDIGWDHYMLAEQKGWVLYLEGSTDLSILLAFAKKLDHPAAPLLERPFVHYVGNLPQKAREHFHGLREAKPDMAGLAIFDHLNRALQPTADLFEAMWSRRELENYFCTESVLMAFTEHIPSGDLFAFSERTLRVTAMQEAIHEISDALRSLGRPELGSDDLKVTDDFLDPLFRKVSEKLSSPLLLRKNEYHRLVDFVQPNEIDPEVVDALDQIVKVAAQACPVTGE